MIIKYIRNLKYRHLKTILRISINYLEFPKRTPKDNWLFRSETPV